MSHENLKYFVLPKAIYQQYNRQNFYDLAKYQLDFFTTIVDFSKHVTIVKDRWKVLIMYFENHPEFQDNNYITIWFRFAEKLQTNMKKVKNIEYKFQRADELKITTGCQVKFKHQANCLIKNRGFNIKIKFTQYNLPFLSFLTNLIW